MRILHIDEQTGWRGGEQQAGYLIRGLARRGHYVATAGRPGAPFLQTDHGVEGIERIAAPFRGEFDLWTAFRLAQAVRRLDIDILHAHTSHAHTRACLARLFARRGRVVVSRRVDFAPSRHFLNRWKYAQPDRIVAVSHCIAGVMRDFGADPARLAVVHSSHDPARFDVQPLTRAELGLPDAVPLIGCVAAFVGHKDHGTLLAATAAARKTLPDLHLVLIGDGERRPFIERRIEELGLRGAATLLGYRKDVPRILPVLDAFVLSSNQEGFGGVCAEAMFSRVPVVSTAAGGMPETVVHEKTGLLTPIEDPDALAAAVVRILTDHVLADRLVVQAHAFVHEHFTADRMVEGYLRVYEELLSTGGAASG